MKNFTQFKKSILGWMAMGLLATTGPIAWAQTPTVQVPTNCEVVVAGTGGTLGFGPTGKVGSGGVVIMPDPDNGTFTIIPNGAVLNNWSLSGDLSFTAPSPTSTIDQSESTTTLSRIIYSYNKNLRQSESMNLARSKGRVTIGYVASACGGAISFDIFKKYSGGNIDPLAANYVPQIIGPDCWLPGETYTYSVDQIASDNLGDGIGIDEYYWTISTGGTTLTNFYTSADKSSITFQTPPTVSSAWTITCAYGRANPWDGNSSPTASHTTVVTKMGGALPVAPVFTTPPPTCLATGSSAFNITLAPSSIVAGYTYTWDIQGASWSLAQSGTSNANLTVTGVDNNPGILILTIEGDCEPAVFTYNINRNFTSAIAITGPLCITPGTSNVYSLPSNALINATTWTLPTGWTIQSTGSNTPRSIANIAVPAGTAAGAYTLTARSTACPSTAISLVVNVKPSLPVFISPSPTCVTRNGGPAVTYAVTPIPGATGYTWTFPTGWSQTSIVNGPASVTVTPGGSTLTGTVTVTAIGTGGCNSATVSRAVNYLPVAPNAISASCWSFGVAGTTTITVANAPNPFYGSYTVTSLPAGLFSSYSVNPTTGAITLNTLASASGTYNLTITHTTASCGSIANAVTLPVTINGSGVAVGITANVPGAGNCDQYSVSGVPGGSTVTWFVNGVQVFSNGTTVNIFGNTLTLCGSTAPTSVCANVATSGCNIRTCAPVVGTHGARTGNSSAEDTSLENISIYPNPSNGNFFIKLNDFRNSANAVITNSSGKHVGTYTLQKGENKIESEGIAKGTYIIILTVDGKKENRQIIIK